MLRDEKIQRARELYAKDYTIRQISRRINVTFQTAKRYVDPEYDERLRVSEKERKKRYTGRCGRCGKITSYAGRGTAGSTHCQECAPIVHKHWTREHVLEAIQKWAREHGRPPSSVDWNASLSKQKRGSEYPSAGAVYGPSSPFASWADAIEAAGFPKPRPTYWGKMGTRYWTRERIIEALKAHSVNGAAPRQVEWAHRGEDRPTAKWVNVVFGNWTRACHAAGLQTFQERYHHGSQPIRVIATRRRQTSPDERLAFVKRVIDDNVPRRFIVRQLWQTWGFSSRRAFSRWLIANGIEEIPGYPFCTRRQLTNEELEEAKTLAFPPAVRRQESRV